MPEIWRRVGEMVADDLEAASPAARRRACSGPTRDGRQAPLAADRLAPGRGRRRPAAELSPLPAGFFAAGFLAAGFFAAGFFAAGFFAAGFGAGFAGAAAATVVSTIVAPAASFCTDATPAIAARFVSYAWLEATT